MEPLLLLLHRHAIMISAHVIMLRLVYGDLPPKGHSVWQQHSTNTCSALCAIFSPSLGGPT
jgi:hypothetical protein